MTPDERTGHAGVRPADQGAKSRSRTPSVAVVVVSYNTSEALLRCLESVLRHADLPTEVVVVDNASGDGSAQAVRDAFPETQVLANEVNRGFSAACNQGLAATHAPLVLFLNPDAALTPGSLATLVGVLQDRAAVGIVGPRTVDGDGAPQLSFGPPLSLLTEWRQRRLVRGLRRRDASALAQVERLCAAAHEPGWVSGSCLLARRELMDAIGGFDERFFLYEEDVDLCVRARAAGWGVAYAPKARVVHALGLSMAQDVRRTRFEYDRSHLIYYESHGGPASCVLLRLWIGVAALVDRLREATPEGRAAASARLRLALRGNSS